MNIATKTNTKVGKRVISGISSCGKEYAVYSTSVHFNLSDVSFCVASKADLKHLNIRAAINIGNICESPIELSDYQCDCAVINGSLLNLPSRALPALTVQGGQLRIIKKLHAYGKVSIGKKTINWAGSDKTSKQDVATLYNNRKIGSGFNHRSTLVNFDDDELAVGLAKKRNELIVNEINSANCISLINNSLVFVGKKQMFQDISCGDIVSNWQIDNLNNASDESICSINCILNKSLSNNVSELRNCFPKNEYKVENIQSPRSALIKTKENEIVLLSVTGNKNHKLQQGLTLIDLHRYIYSHYNVDWAVCTSNETNLIVNPSFFPEVINGPEQYQYCKKANYYLCVY